MIRVVIVGDGYAAADLVRVLSLHEKVRIAAVTSVDNVGRKISSSTQV